MSSISTPPDKTNDRLSSSPRAGHSRSTGMIFDWILKSLRRSLQEAVARHRVLHPIDAAAVLDPEIRVTLKSLVKRLLVSVGHRLDRLVEGPSVQALFTRALSVCGLSHV
jgi:hypothetical protein